MAVVEFQGKEYHCREDENILVALLRQGVELKHSCRAGVCNACVMQTVDAHGESLKVGGLDAALVNQGCFLPCKTRVKRRLVIQEPPSVVDDSYGLVLHKRWLNGETVELTIDPAYSPDYQPGQFIELIHPDGTRRPYSLASSPMTSMSLMLHVRRHDHGKVSRWVADQLLEGDTVQLSYPQGNCHLTADMKRVVMLGFGVGLAPLYGMTQQILAGGTGVEKASLIHLARTLTEGVIDNSQTANAGLYLDTELRKLALSPVGEYQPTHAAFEYTGLVGRNSLFGDSGYFKAQLEPLTKDSTVYWFVCGSPGAVNRIRDQLKALGVDDQRILFDPFETASLSELTSTGIQGVQESNSQIEERPYPETQPELWAWLEQDNRLSFIISDFYQRIFNDERLLPYFHNTTQQRSREKVYSFYKRLFSGEPCFFGDRPRNAHHWMVITNEIYDHRLTVLEATLRDHQLPDNLLGKWLEYEEYYRSDIVKDEPRGRQVGDMIQPAGGFGRETLTCGAICDSCGAIIEAGESVLYHLRTGQLYCKDCETGGIEDV